MLISFPPTFQNHSSPSCTSTQYDITFFIQYTFYGTKNVIHATGMNGHTRLNVIVNFSKNLLADIRNTMISFRRGLYNRSSHGYVSFTYINVLKWSWKSLNSLFACFRTWVDNYVKPKADEEHVLSQLVFIKCRNVFHKRHYSTTYRLYGTTKLHFLLEIQFPKLDLTAGST